MPGGGAFVPKYVQIVETLRRRIADGAYPIGSKLPSETELIREFGVSRPTVVRALQEMALLGEIEREHGRGSFVKAIADTRPEDRRPALAVLDRQETELPLKVVQVGPEPAPTRVAGRLGVVEEARAHLRRSVGFFDDSTPSEVVSLWAPLDVAKAAGLEPERPLTVPLRRLLTAGTGERLARVVETLTARRATEQEADLLQLAPDEPVLGVLASVVDTTGRTVLVVEVTLPGFLHDLEDTYPL
ncbi:GntR family transcriptional regulator [Thermomonospora cellulosilytica]|uniref:DNA-binding GntR family transcriptional regulator n=1 Tax=Thermomonospora cellulosilytica TaxID=1411118 RepID=A0A7W3R711_9ACTN|nr:GntR family transcriptional regulator [Thermomonospora cellulosilytica]MBA9002192.1 DNA-binding GntR family transcriptional regulator [Thermomonospora cellulosilytica]